MTRRRIAVIGGGWAGISAAVHATGRGHDVTLIEMAPQLGGRARSFELHGMPFDNGQHIAIGAYSQTLALMRQVGIDVDAAFLRTPLRLVDANGVGLVFPAGNPSASFVRAVAAHRGWGWRDKASLLAAATGWALRRFRCGSALTVAQLAARLTRPVVEDLVEPLCVAALNTGADAASASVFLRVLQDALFAGPGSSDLLLPRRPLSGLLAEPSQRWLADAGARIETTHRVESIEPDPSGGWRVDGARFDAAVLGCSAIEAARLTSALAPAWSRAAASLGHEPIMTLYFRNEGCRLPAPMLALRCTPGWPAQFVFDRGQLGGPAGLLAFVISGAQAWVDQGHPAALQAVARQAEALLAGSLRGPLQPVKAMTEHRATFRCVPGLVRPETAVVPGIAAAADFVRGPYPATLEGAVRSGIAAVRQLEEMAG